MLNVVIPAKSFLHYLQFFILLLTWGAVLAAFEILPQLCCCSDKDKTEMKPPPKKAKQGFPLTATIRGPAGTPVLLLSFIDPYGVIWHCMLNE